MAIGIAGNSVEVRTNCRYRSGRSAAHYHGTATSCASRVGWLVTSVHHRHLCSSLPARTFAISLDHSRGCPV